MAEATTHPLDTAWLAVGRKSKEDTAGKTTRAFREFCAGMGPKDVPKHREFPDWIKRIIGEPPARPEWFRTATQRSGIIHMGLRGYVHHGAFFRQYALQFPKHTPSDAWDKAMRQQLRYERLYQLDPERAYGKGRYAKFTEYSDEARDDELFDDSHRTEFYRYETKKDAFLSTFDRGTALLSWRWHPEVFETTGVRRLLEGKGLSELEIQKMRLAAERAWADEAAYVAAVSYDRARTYADFRYEGPHFLGRDLDVYAVDDRGRLVVNDSGRPHKHGSAKAALDCAGREGSPKSPNPCHGVLNHWLVRDDGTYRSFKRVAPGDGLKPEDLTVNLEVSPSRKKWHKQELIAGVVKELGEPKVVKGLNKRGLPVMVKRITKGKATKFYSKAFGKHLPPNIEIPDGVVDPFKRAVAYELERVRIVPPVHEAVAEIAEQTGREPGEVAKIFRPFVGLRLYPDHREIRLDTAAKIRAEVSRRRRRDEASIALIQARLRLMAAGEEWPADPPARLYEGKQPESKPAALLTHAHLAALDIQRWTGPRLRDDDTLVYALPEGTVAGAGIPANVARYRQQQAGIMRVKKPRTSADEEWEDYEALIDAAKAEAPEMAELEEPDTEAKPEGFGGEAWRTKRKPWRSLGGPARCSKPNPSSRTAPEPPPQKGRGRRPRSRARSRRRSSRP